MKPRVSGYLTGVHFRDGQYVRQGQLLFTIDARPAQAQLDQARAQLARAEAQLVNARTELARSRTLAEQKAASVEEVEQRQAALRSAQADVAAGRAAVRARQLDTGFTRVTAPISGQVSQRLVDPGNYVSMSDATGICVITLMRPMSVLFSIPEDALPAVRKRLQAGATLQATALDRAQKNELGVGKLTTTDNQIDTSTGTVKLRAMFDNTDEALFPNQFVNINLLVDTMRDALVVPVAAIH